ncbi:hypothetical protein P6144_20235 [Sphingomonas sp. HITSZ_GF]|uniref:hypothetical protein n=1 Tax=Sphingomonas sp. HITSZ_GF TaxID=3037247 RepID=UPI00240D0AE5|nr:hypothetical protein [Sphingomonas sp. HITSZ_GF]MDG2536000.1 hypothetical protein [Sphingomonas sp. HITSZ_GF]
MSKTPPKPQEAQSPYPIEEAPHDHDEGSEALKAVKDIADAKKRWKPDAKQIGMGAAIGIGSAAIVAGLLYWRGGKK